MQAITRYLASAGFTTADDCVYSAIELWRKWYSGKVRSFHNYTQYNGRTKVKRTRKALGMGKKIAEDWASLLMNERVQITVSKDSAHERVWDVLDRNNFRVRANQLVEIAFALGTGAFVEYMDGMDVVVDYVRASMIYPIEWDNGEITGCAFASERKVGKERRVYLNIHKRDASGQYIIENAMFRKEGDSLQPVDLPDGVLPEVFTGSTVPRFQIITPNIVNNIEMDSPMGISVFANALDQIEDCDMVFDSYYNEFRLGKKRVLVPMSMARVMMEQDGAAIPVFDDNDVEFYVLATGQDAEGKKIEEINGTLRYEAHESGVATAINLCGYKCGFGENHYRFENGAAKTATEVISINDDMYKNKVKHQKILEGAIVGLVHAITDMLGIREDYDVAIAFDDSIIEDSNAERVRDMQDVRESIMSRVEYRMKWYGETEEDAVKAIESIDGVSDDETMGFGGGRNADA